MPKKKAAPKAVAKKVAKNQARKATRLERKAEADAKHEEQPFRFPDPVSAFAEKYPTILDTIFDQLLLPDHRYTIQDLPADADETGNPANRISIVLADMKRPVEKQRFVVLMMPGADHAEIHPELFKGVKELSQYTYAREKNTASKFMVNKAWNKYLEDRLRRGKEPGHKILKVVIRCLPHCAVEASRALITRVLRKHPTRGDFITAKYALTNMKGACPSCLIILFNSKGSPDYVTLRGMLLAGYKFYKTGLCGGDCPGVDFGVIAELIWVKKGSPRLLQLEMELVDLMDKIEKDKNYVTPEKFAAFNLKEAGILGDEEAPEFMRFPVPENAQFLDL